MYYYVCHIIITTNVAPAATVATPLNKNPGDVLILFVLSGSECENQQ